MEENNEYNDQTKKVEDNCENEITDIPKSNNKKDWSTIIIIAILGVAFIASIYTNGFTTFGQKSDGEIKIQVTDFINKNFLSGQNADFKIMGTSKTGLYVLDVTVNGLSQKIYATADGQFLFLQAVPMKQQIVQPTNAAKH